MADFTSAALSSELPDWARKVQGSQRGGVTPAPAPSQSGLLEAALNYARKGYYVLPVTIAIDPKDGKKKPTFHAKWGSESSTDPDQIRHWFTQYPDSGIAIDTNRSGIAVVDLDGPEGLDGWAKLVREHGDTTTAWVRTRSGGAHHYYRQRPGDEIYNTASSVAPKIDVRGARREGKGSGGIVFTSPTRIQGRPEQSYEWMTNLPRAEELPLIPEWLPALARQRAEKVAQEKAAKKRSSARLAEGAASVAIDTPMGETPAGLARYLEKKAQEIRDLPVGGAATQPVNDIAFELAHYVAGGLLTEDQVREALQAAVDTWEDGHRLGYEGIEQGLRDWRNLEPKVWEERAPRPNLRVLPQPQGGDLPRIDITTEPGAMRAITQVLADGKLPDLFTRNGEVVRVSETEGEVGKHLEIRALGADGLRMMLADHADCYKIQRGRDRDQEVEASPSVPVAKAVLSRPEWPTMRFLAGATAFPLFQKDGRVSFEPGYDPGTRYFLRPIYPVRPVAERPTPEEVAKAKRLILDEVLHDVAWDSEASRVNYLGVLITPMIRMYVDGLLPLVVLSATVPGSGKSLLAEILNAVYTMSLNTWAKTDTECGKVILSVLRTTTQPVVLFDNVDEGDSVNHATLAALLTSREYTGRVLGESSTHRAANNRLWCVTGNNVNLGPDVSTRSILVRLAPPMENPEERKGFRIEELYGLTIHDWLEKADNRSALLEALTILVRDWIAAGAPRDSSQRMRNFTDWAQAAGGFLAHHGISGFMENKGKLRVEGEDDHSYMIRFLAKWREKFGDRPMKAADLVASTAPDLTGGTPYDGWEGTFPEKENPESGLTSSHNAKSLGRFLGTREDRVYGDYTLRKVTIDKRNKTVGYWVEETGASTRGSHEAT